MQFKYELIEKVVITDAVLEKTIFYAQAFGSRHYEVCVLWAGNFIDKTNFLIDTSYLPEQTSTYSIFGVGFSISGDEIYQVSKWLFENQKELIAQVHSHPTDAFHSHVDELFPLVTAVGQLSIVIPFFGLSEKNQLSDFAIFRLSRHSEWIKLNQKEISKFFSLKYGSR